MEEAKRKIQERIEKINNECGYNAANTEVAIYESTESDKVLNFVKLYFFTDLFINKFLNGEIWGVTYNNGQIIAQTIWGDILKNIAV
jgi:hypothetical protein